MGHRGFPRGYFHRLGGWFGIILYPLFRMIGISYPCDTVISAPGEPWDGSNVSWACTVDLPSSTCQDIVFAFENYRQAEGYYPVSCDFSTLSYSGTVFFQNPNNLHYDYSMEVYALEVPQLTHTDLDFVYSIQTGFMIVLIGFWTIARQLRKISPLLFG